MDIVGFAKFEEALLREIRIKLDLIHHRMDPSSRYEALELRSRKIRDSWKSLGIAERESVFVLPINFVFPLSTSCSIASHVRL